MIRKFAFLLVLVLLGSCSSLSPVQTQSQRWQNQNISSYSYDIKWSCFCLPDLSNKVHIEVKNSKLVSRQYVNNKKAIPKEYHKFFTSIDGLIKILKEAEDQNAYKIDINWNKDYNYPQSSDIDYIKDAIDDERSFTVTNFKLK